MFFTIYIVTHSLQTTAKLPYFKSWRLTMDGRCWIIELLGKREVDSIYWTVYCSSVERRACFLNSLWKPRLPFVTIHPSHFKTLQGRVARPVEEVSGRRFCSELTKETRKAKRLTIILLYE